MRINISKLLLYLSASSLLSSCASVDQIEMAYDNYRSSVSRYIASVKGQYHPSEFEINKDNLYKLQEEIELNLVWRKNFANAKKKEDQNSLKFISPYFNQNQKITANLNRFLKNIDWVTDPTTRFEIRTDKISSIEQRKEIYFVGNRKLKRKERDVDFAIINPYDEIGQDTFKAIKVGLIANIAIYENHLLLKRKIAEAIKIESDPTLQKELELYHEKLEEKLKNSPSHMKLANLLSMYRDITIFEKAKTKSKLSYYIDPLIEETLVYSNVHKELHKKKRWNQETKVIHDIVAKMATTVDKRFAVYFKKSIKFENPTYGEVTKIGKNEKAHLLYQLKPMDIVFIHNENNFNNAVVEKFWDNVGIWIGSWDDIVKLGLSTHPLIKEHQDKIQTQDLNFLVSTRQGVQLKSLNSAINQDDLAVIRKRRLSYLETVKGLTLAFSNIGKPYDYAMNPEDKKKISFAQLVFDSYPQVNWDKSFTYKQEAVSPYKITQRTGENKEFFTVLLYKNGQEVLEDLEENFRTISSQN
ncbi:YiiX/YebB-like N1pC/P60 family cysteine hydrolase [Halobacteriovorax sp.]|uniref:YiiX/YebB-like N1pC/P60 family cysteine hydrolase n=1 Tax=Halobacteriovorax sp. TaxID=2020862 RepID=UPI003AF20F26